VEEQVKAVAERGRRKTRVGFVVGTQMDKTAVVKVERRQQHPKFKRYVLRTAKYLVHDEKNQLQVGDKVRIIETRPLSKRKNWRLHQVIEKTK
jgi:small subunit ribosomal protein S17